MTQVLAPFAEAALPEGLYITEELGRRPTRGVDPVRESQGLQQLARGVAEAPAEVLPRFLELAMELTGAPSAGLSLLEPDSTPEIFRWTHVRGAFAPFDGGTAPRNSPCGVTLDRNSCVLARHPERAYPWISEANIVVPEVLLVPLYIGTDEPLGTLWVVSDRPEHFCEEDARVTRELAAFVGQILRMIERERVLRESLDERELLASEVSLRLRNIFTPLAELAALARESSETRRLADALTERLHALVHADAVVRRNAPSVGKGASGAPDAEESRSQDVETLARMAARFAGRDPDSHVTISLGDVVAFDDLAWRYVDFVLRAEAGYAALTGDLPALE